MQKLDYKRVALVLKVENVDISLDQPFLKDDEVWIKVWINLF